MQNCKITWSVEALNDLEDYIDWYLQNANEVIATEFIQVIEDAIETIRNNNYIARMVDEIPELREYVVQKFPYIISYWIKDQSNVVITAFLHQNMKK
ncbi:MAG TPA: type II toxin-antitoxin system RelE/ParE family toxin [Burkholderiales bacterium]|nr:type II toxin-antitoxin system RelE/ParE family toxin [Burkholderiales bacterium]